MIGSISSINPMNFQVRTPNVMVTVRQNNSSIHPTYFNLFIATSQDLFNPCPCMFRPRIRLMGHHGTQFRAKADLPVGFPYRFNSSIIYILYFVNIDNFPMFPFKTKFSVQHTLITGFFKFFK